MHTDTNQQSDTAAPVLDLSLEEMQDFLQHGELMDRYVLPVVCVREASKYGDERSLTPLEQQVYDRIVTDLATIDSLFNNFKGAKAQIECQFNLEEIGNNGYTFERQDFIGHHVISLKRPGRDRFYWTIGVRYDENADDMSGAAIYGYYHMGTNGSIDDVLEAFESVRHLFPQVAPRPSARARLAP